MSEWLGAALSQRDLPVWARAVTAVFLLAGGWFSARWAMQEGFGGWVVDLSAGVIAVFVLLGMRLPLDLWPRAPQRARFSVWIALLAALILGLFIRLGGPFTGAVATEETGALIPVLIGGVAIALAAGKTRVEVYGWWFGVAALCAVLPAITGVSILSMREAGLPSIDAARLMHGSALFLVLGVSASLVTQELAFRRLLIGQSGDAGLVAVMLAALLFGIWHATNPAVQTGVLPALLSGAAGGMVAGSLYILSRSLLVPAFYYGIRIGLIRGIELATGDAPGVADTLETVGAISSLAIAAVLAISVVRRSGLFGALQIRPLADAAGD